MVRESLQLECRLVNQMHGVRGVRYIRSDGRQD